jgi:HK97 family phage prohead protease
MTAALTIALPVQHRGAAVRAASYREDDNSIEIVWTTGAAVRRVSWIDGPYDEILEVTPQAVKLDRLNLGAPFLDTHDSLDLSRVLGSVVPGSARIAGGKGYARIMLSDAPDVASSVAKIKEGTVKNISVGYRVIKVEKTEAAAGEIPIHRIVEWEPMEVSAVPIPADPGAQVRAEGQTTFPAIIISKEGKMPAKTTANPADDMAAVEAERKRAATITELATRAGVPDMIAPAITNETSVDEFSRALLDRLYQDENRAHPGGPGMQTATDYADRSLDQRRARAMESAILHRVDPMAFKLEPGAEAFMAMPLLEIARAAVEGRGTRTYGMSKMQIAAAALAQRSMGGMHTTSDFPAILANVANKTLRTAYEAAPQTFRPLVRVTTVADFKEVSRTQISEAPSLEKVNEHGEFKRGTMGETAEKFRLETFGKIIGVTRTAIVNDDMSAFDRIPRAFGAQAAQLESDLVWAQIMANAAMSDGVALFHNNHANLLTAGAIGEVTVGEARKKMGLQTGLDGKSVLNLTPQFIIVPKALEVAALKFVTSITPAKTEDAVPREIRNLTVIAEPRLDLGIARYGIAGSASNYYFATSPTFVDVIELAYLEGAQGIYTETRNGFDIDGIEIKARLDVAAKVIDHRGLSKNPFAG